MLSQYTGAKAHSASESARSQTGKMLGIFFPIWLFITSGFEHSVANMYYIPAGIMAAGNELFAKASGLSAEALAVSAKFNACFTDDEVNHCFAQLCAANYFGKARF